MKADVNCPASVWCHHICRHDSESGVTTGTGGCADAAHAALMCMLCSSHSPFLNYYDCKSRTAGQELPSGGVRPCVATVVAAARIAGTPVDIPSGRSDSRTDQKSHLECQHCSALDGWAYLRGK